MCRSLLRPSIILIVTHEVTNSGSDRAQLANMGRHAREALGVDKLEAVADRGYYNNTEIKASPPPAEKVARDPAALRAPEARSAGDQPRGSPGPCCSSATAMKGQKPSPCATVFP